MNLKKHYDVAIIGGGIGGIMTAYRLIEKNPEMKVLIMEKGHAIKQRHCPIVTGNVKKCIKCSSCAIMEGMAGAGAFSDGKYVISTEYGGWLTEFLDPQTVIEYIEQADAALVKFGATTERFMPNDELKYLCLQHDLHMSQAQLKHLGTDCNFETMRKLIEYLEDKVDIAVNTEATDIKKDTKEIHCIHKGVADVITAEKIIFAVGRAGSRFFSDWCEKNNIPLQNNQVDIGVRVELPSMVWNHFSKKIYE
ncbi:MAG: FAD-dependent oxidoreductase, partial [Anaerotignum sp.]